MIRSGLVSITFRKLSPHTIIDLVTRAGLTGIEWGGDVHVPHGEIDVAREVAQMTRDAGLLVAAYGSYYRVGVSEADGLAFERVLETAMALGAPTVRVWAGNRGSADADESYRAAVVDDARRIAVLAHAAGITVSFEYHRNTLTDTNASAHRLLEGGEPPKCAYLLAAARGYVTGGMPPGVGCRLRLSQQRARVSVGGGSTHGHRRSAAAGRRRCHVAAIPGADRRHRPRSLRFDRVRAG